MYNRFSRVLLIIFTIMVSSCATRYDGVEKPGLIDSIALSRFSAIMDKASVQMEKESNFEEIESTFLSNIKLIEALWSVDEENKNLLRSLIKGYGSYAFGVDETHLLRDNLKEIDDSPHHRKANLHYTKAINYGLRYLALEGIKYSDLLVATKQGTVKELLNSKLSNDIGDLEAVFFTTQSLAGLINLNKDNMKLLSQMGTMKPLMEWVCDKNPNIHQGACDLFFATYEASLPAMLGGKPAKAVRLYKEGLKKFPNNLLLRVSFVQFYILPRMDEDLYNKQKPIIKGQIKKIEASKLDWPKLKGSKQDRLNAFNAIAAERFKIIEKFEKEIF
jgi:hypothetical protein